MTFEEILDHMFVCPSGCVLWMGGASGGERGSNYGRVRFEGTVQSVHRVVWEKEFGPIPEGYELDHLCARWGGRDPLLSRRCCNLQHLECVPRRVNNKRRVLRKRGEGR